MRCKQREGAMREKVEIKGGGERGHTVKPPIGNVQHH